MKRVVGFMALLISLIFFLSLFTVTNTTVFAETSTLSDDFSRPDGPVGTAPTGQTWKVSGLGVTSAQIKDGHFVTSGLPTYLYQEVPSLKTMSTVFNFTQAGNPDSVVELISSADSFLYNQYVSVSISPAAWSIQTSDPKSGKATLASGTFSQALKTDGTDYTLSMTRDGSTLRVILPDGTSREVTNPKIASNSGPWAAWFLSYDMYSSPARLNSVLATSNVIQTPTPTPTPLEMVAYDDFNRPDGPLTSLPSGQTWQQVEPPHPASGVVKAYIRNKQLVADDSLMSATAAYNGFALSGPPARMSATIAFSPGWAGYGAVALIANKQGLSTISDIKQNSVHIIFTDTYCQPTLFVNNEYLVLGTYYYQTPLKQDGTPYKVGWTLNGNTMTLDLPDGTERIVTNSNFSSVNGKYLTFEHYWQTGFATRPRFISIQAYQ